MLSWAQKRLRVPQHIQMSGSTIRRSMAGENILEVGRGTGSMTTWLAKQVGRKGHIIAVDASEKQVELA